MATEQEIQDAIDAIIAGGVSGYSISNRSVSKLDPKMLRELLDKEKKRADGKPRAFVAKMRRPLS